MTLSEKRQDAASTLVVPYDATPDMVDAAYERRLEQRFGLANMDLESMVHGNEALYDARVRMRLPEKMQWYAALRLLVTTKVDKIMNITMVRFQQLRRAAQSEISQKLADDLISDHNKVCRKYNVFCAVLGYEIAGIWTPIVYGNVSQEPNPIVPIVIYGSTIIGGLVVAHLMGSMRRRTAIMGIKHELLQAILQDEKEFQK